MSNLIDANKRLAETHLLVSFTGGTRLTTNRGHAGISREQEKAHGMQEGTIRSVVSLFPDANVAAPIHRCNSAHNAVRTLCKEAPCHAWGDTTAKHTSIISKLDYFKELMPEYKKRSDAAATAKAELLQTYESIVAQSAPKLGDILGQEKIEYPSLADVDKCFHIPGLGEITSTIDVATPFEVSATIPTGAAQDIITQLSANADQASATIKNMATTMDNLQARYVEATNAIVQKMTRLENGERVALHDSLHDNLFDVVRAMQMTNIFNNDKVSLLASKTESLEPFLKVANMRDNATKVAHVASRLRDYGKSFNWGAE